MPALPVASLFAEVRALTRDGVVPPPLINALQHRLERVKAPLQADTVASLALLTAARGERRQARQLMESVAWLDPRAVPASTSEYAIGWLVTDAAAEGEWTHFPLAPGGAGQGEGVPLRFFRHLAARARGEAHTLAQDDWYQLPEEARRFSETFKPLTPSRVEQPPLADPLAALLQQLLTLETLRSVRACPERSRGAESRTLSDLSRQLSTLLQSQPLRDRLMERATLLGGGSPDEALQDLRALCEATLGDALFRLEADSDALLRRVAAKRRELLIEELHARLDALTDLCQAGTAPPMPEVWREFLEIRSRYERAVALSEPAERGWPHHVVLRLTRYFGTWLRLTKKERPFAHAVFHFLEVEGARAGDETSARLARASGELCLPFKLD